MDSRLNPLLVSGTFKPGKEVIVSYNNELYQCIVFWNKEKEKSYISINGNQFDQFDCLLRGW